jgi:hypothetical protein
MQSGGDEVECPERGHDLCGAAVRMSGAPDGEADPGGRTVGSPSRAPSPCTPPYELPEARAAFFQPRPDDAPPAGTYGSRQRGRCASPARQRAQPGHAIPSLGWPSTSTVSPSWIRSRSIRSRSTVFSPTATASSSDACHASTPSGRGTRSNCGRVHRGQAGGGVRRVASSWRRRGRRSAAGSRARRGRSPRGRRTAGRGRYARVRGRPATSASRRSCASRVVLRSGASRGLGPVSQCRRPSLRRIGMTSAPNSFSSFA